MQVSYIDSPFSGDPGVRNQAPSETPNLASDVDDKPGMPLSGPGGQIPGAVQCSYISYPEVPGVRNQAPSETPDLTSDADRKPGMPLAGFSGPDTGIVPFLHACSHDQWDGKFVFDGILYAVCVGSLFIV